MGLWAWPTGEGQRMTYKIWSLGSRHLYLVSHIAPGTPPHPLYFLRQSLSLYLVLGALTRLADQYTPGILLPLPSCHRDCRCFYKVLGTELRASCWFCKHFYQLSYRPAPISWFFLPSHDFPFFHKTSSTPLFVVMWLTESLSSLMSEQGTRRPRFSFPHTRNEHFLWSGTGTSGRRS